MDYAALRQEGIRQLERLAGGQWTDYNAHDPGITILEQLCYALTDLGYRTAYEIPDLLAEDGGDPYHSLHPPAEILTCRPVTPADLRRLVLDVDGVKNAWVEPLEQDALPLYYHPDRNELSMSPDPPPSEPVKLKGLYRVLIEAVVDPPPADLLVKVVRRLHENRGLCEDFAEITVLSRQTIQVSTKIEIGLVDDIGRLRGDIVQKIADVISPPVPFVTLDDMLRAGRSVDEIFDGPRLEHGFLTEEVLERATRRAAINISDLIHAIMDIPGVRAVRELRIADDGKTWEDWSLKTDPDRVAKLEVATITLLREGKTVGPSGAPASLPAPLPAAGTTNPLIPPVGRDRNVRRYWSVQHHLPALYGVGELGLRGSATPERKARAKQLKAYLMFFDQLMANYLEQLAHVKDLFSFDGAEARTYFAQRLDQPGLGLEVIRDPARDEYMTLLASLGQNSDGHTTSPIDLERKSRFLNHLLARFAEALEDPDASKTEDLAARKQAFLKQYPRLGGARGTAFNYLAPTVPGSRSGLEDRLRLRLGLAPDEAFLVVEHILLRPMEGDENQQIPLLASALSKDPYSLQLTFILNQDGFKTGAGQRDGFKALVEQAIRAETPAHLTPYAMWMAGNDWTAFQTAYTTWLGKRRTYMAEKLRVNLKDLGW
jgi:hypothetical protein